MNDDRPNNPAFTLPPPLPRIDPEPEVDSLVSALLKAPTQVGRVIAGDPSVIPRQAVILLLVGMLCHAVFGLSIGFFSGWNVALMDAVKMPLVALCSMLLCFPSLYVFACISGAPITLPQTLALGSACLAMIGLILVGLAPVAWLFSVSTEAVPFIVFLAVVIWIIALAFTVRFVGKLASVPLFSRQDGIRVWFFILTVVTLQMTTCMRPMLSMPSASWWTGGKQFFLSHFASTFETLER